MALMTKRMKSIEPHIKAMISSEGEKVDLSTIISTAEARGAVGKRLLQVEQIMTQSVRDVIEVARDDYPKNIRHDWVKNWPGQVVLAVTQLFWTSEVQEAIDEGGSVQLAKYGVRLQDDLMKIVELVRGKLTKQTRFTLGAHITLNIHARDVVNEMALDQKVETSSDFKWLAQLCFYWINSNVR